jgi:pSer/pThr/pTyr-binding forkhead associated (FHA) protein
MAVLTFRVLDGADRGRAFEHLPTPVTIGREEGNAVQLNDERVSRFHLKIQEDQEKTVLVDLQSTNGTKVNGESVQFWILRPGDVIAVGKSLLLFGSDDQIAARLARLRGEDLTGAALLDSDSLAEEAGRSSPLLEAELFWAKDPDHQALLHALLPPELPGGLSAGQAAQLSELLHYLQLRLRALLDSVKSVSRSDRVTLEQRQWQNLLDLQRRLGGYLRQIGEPEK